MLFGVVWMGTQAVLPYVLGRAVDDGIADRDARALRQWVLVLVGIVLVQAVSGTCRHRFAVANWMLAAFRSSQWVNAQVVRLGAGLPARTSAGEVVSVGATDTVATCCTAWTWPCVPVSDWPSSDRPVLGSPHWAGCWRVCTGHGAVRSPWAACRCWTCRWSRCAPRSAS